MAGEEKYFDHFQHFHKVNVLYRYPFKGKKRFYFLGPFSSVKQIKSSPPSFQHAYLQGDHM
jgi:hypothetical protein